MNIFVYEFLEDMRDVGLATWAGMLIAFGAMLWVGWSNGSMWLRLIGGIMTANLFAAVLVTLWWEYSGRKKHAY